jgi:hypothetical protein
MSRRPMKLSTLGDGGFVSALGPRRRVWNVQTQPVRAEPDLALRAGPIRAET